MKVKDIIRALEIIAPPQLQEDYDNSGLMCGNPEAEVNSALISLDCTEAVVEEAISNENQLLICHHPLIFGGITSISGKNEVERCLIKAIKHDLSIYAIHTNLDNVHQGVNRKIAERLGLQELKILRPRKNLLKKLVFFVPTKQATAVRDAIFKAGAGQIGNYSDCSFNLSGEGTFKAGEGSDPYAGKQGELHTEEEIRVESVFPAYLQSTVLKALRKAHPYEEVAYDIYSLDNHWNNVGSGMIGELEEEVAAIDFLKLIKDKMKCDCIRHTRLSTDTVKKVAFCGGSGSFLLKDAIRAGADVFITGDFKYHQFFEADEKLIIADIGHYESEQFTPDLLQEHLQEKIPNFATYLSQTKTNPINYLK